MINSFNVLDTIFDICSKDDILLDYLQANKKLSGNQLLEELNKKINREYQTAEIIKPKDVPFISYYFMHAEKSKRNWLVNVGDLYVDVYASSMYEVELIVTRFRELMIDSNLGMLLNYEGQHFSGVNNVYKYRLIYNPLIDGE